MRMQIANETRFRPAPLAASMTLVCSGGALAEPGEPVLEWMEQAYVMEESDDAVQVPVAWTRHYGAPVLTGDICKSGVWSRTASLI
jgi:hypothetical protein